MRRLLIVGACLLVAQVTSGTASHYLTLGGDAARTGWLKNEKVFTVANVGKTRLLWKIKLDTLPREMHSLHPPLVVEGVQTSQGPKEIAVLAGVSDDLFGIDAVTGAVIWKKHFDSTYTPAQPSGGNTFCPGGQVAAPVVGPGPTAGTFTAYALPWDGRLRQVNVADGTDVAPPERFAPPNAKPQALNLQDGVIYTTMAQGCGGIPHSFFSYDLKTRRTSVFLPGGGGLWGKRGPAVDETGTVYMGTGDGPFLPANRMLGNAVVAVRIDATHQLQLADFFAPPNANWLYRRDLDLNVSPVAFDYKGRRLLVTSSKECRVWLLDRARLGGEDHRTALDTTPLICNEHARIDLGVWGGITAWRGADDTQWVVVPFWGAVASTFRAEVEHARPERGGVVAFKVEESRGQWKLRPAWMSRDIDMAEEVLVGNGVVFTYGSGEDIQQIATDRAWDDPPLPTPPVLPTASAGSARRIANSTHATIYALDALTGKELWSSGDQVTSWNHFSGLSVANGRIYLPTYDGHLYCFGVPR